MSRTSLRPGNETDGFFSPGPPFLFPLSPTIFPAYPVLLEKLGTEIVKTPLGKFKCQHYFVRIRSPSGKLQPLLEVWAHPEARPLGIVRARWRDETLNLVELKAALPIKIPKGLSATRNKKPIREGGCLQCHHQGMGGRNLTFRSKYRLSGIQVNLTECLFHYYQTGLIQASDPIRLQIHSKSGRIAFRELVEFRWKKGSFWVNTNQSGQLTLFLDAFASQGNLRAMPRTGSLVLNLQK